MRVITKIPLNYKFDDDSLFDFIPMKKIRRSMIGYLDDSNYSFVLFKKLKNFNFKNQYTDSSKKNHKNVVIKNIGNMNQKHLGNALEYVLRNSEDKMAINEDFEFKTYKEILQDWKEDFSNNEDTKEALHLVFSLKELHSDSIMEILKTSVYETMKSNFRDYQFVLIPHIHQSNPHIHCIINKTNIWTANKLRFNKKSDCRDFFFKLKEDFKNELYYLSGGKLDYKNDVSIKLDNIFKEFDSINQQSHNFNHRGFYTQGIKDLNTHYSKNKRLIQDLELKVMKLYQNNNSNFSDKTKQIRIIQNKIKFYQQTSKKIQEDIILLSDWNDNFSNFAKSFNLFEKKKALYHSMIKMKPYASKTLFKHLDILQKELVQEKIWIQEGMIDIDKGFDKNIFLSEKTNMFALNKYYKQLKNYSLMLKGFEVEDSNFNIKEVLKRLQEKKQEILGLIEMRIKRLLVIHKNLKLNTEEQEANLNKIFKNTQSMSFETIDNIIKLTSKHLRNLKALSFTGKELLLAKKILKDNKALFNFNQKNQDKITTQIKTLQQITQNFPQKEDKEIKKQR